ncbi:uncharacterized protein LOC143342616 isoform X2 [Colletes latitarsis]|uniref:uncharacterized protein LOC143342616 isoform X2 n=1 Tax=Colletes latitarsis TaxID=2605962 RepID=UPI004036AB44
MARVFIYERHIDAVLTNALFYDKLNYFQHGRKIKEEAPDYNTYDHDDSSVSDTRAVTRIQSTVLKDKFSNLTNNKENENTKLDLNKEIRKSKRIGKRFSPEEEQRSNTIHLKHNTKLKRYVECDVCFLPFKNKLYMKNHRAKNDATYKCACDICKAVFYSDQINRHRKKCLKSQVFKDPRYKRYVCHFCERKFSQKIRLQAHIFHIHGNLIFSSVTNAVEAEDNLSMKTVNYHVANSGTGKVKQDVLKENTNNHVANIDTAGRLKSLSNSPVKKLRQTTLVEFLSFFSKKQEEECINSEKVSSTKNTAVIHRRGKIREINSSSTEVNMSRKIESSTSIPPVTIHPTDKTPFVQIHVNTYTMEALLNDEIKIEPEDVYSPTTSHNTSYNLRRIGRGDSNRSSAALDSGLGAESLNNERFLTRKRKRRNVLSYEQKLKSKFKYKECVIYLERCDKILNGFDKSKHILRHVDTIKVEENSENAELTCPSKLILKTLEVPLVRVQKPVEIESDESPTYVEKPDIANVSIEPSSIEVLQCKICKKSFPSEDIRKHVETSHTVYMSSICNARYTTRDKLLNHYLNQHIVFKRKECCVCYEQFRTSMMLKSHMLLHCLKAMRSKNDSLPIDRKIRCNAFKKQYRCNPCGKRFWLNSCLNHHQKVCYWMKKARKGEQQVPCAKTSSSFVEEENTGECDSIRPVVQESRSRVIDNTTSTINSFLNTCSPSSPPASQTKPPQTRSTANPKKLINSIVCVKGYQVDVTGMDKIKFPCLVCDKQFQTFQNLCLHERTYCKPANSPCTVCGTIFTTKRLLQLHTLATHAHFCPSKYKYFCKFCNQGFIKKSNVQVHERHFHIKQTITPSRLEENDDSVWNINTVCSICNLMFESYDRFIEHNKYYYRGQVFTCTFCGESFEGMYMLHNHNKSVHYTEAMRNSYTYKCNICNEGFKQKSHFHAHKFHVHLEDLKTMEDHSYALRVNNVDARINIPLMVSTCKICTLEFTNKTDLWMHEMEYSVDGDFQCAKCDRKCRTVDILSKHDSLTHNNCLIGNYYKCRFCEEVLTTSISLSCHEKHFHASISSSLESSQNACGLLDANHEAGNKAADKCDDRTNNIKCLTCGMRFNDEAKLQDHLLEYSDIGAYACDVCQRKFTELHRLEVHRVKHSRLSYILSKRHCPICHEGFPDAANVRMHMLHFHGYETFSSVLIKRYDDKKDTNNEESQFNHLIDEPVKLPEPSILSSANQSQGRSFKCSECDVTFNSRRNLHKHRSRFVNTGNYECEYCGRKFPWLTLFKAHVFTHYTHSR